MLDLEPVNPGGIGSFYVEIIKKIIDIVNNPDAKWLCVAIGTQVYAVDIQVLDYRPITRGFEQGIDFLDDKGLRSRLPGR